ncbi:MAG TPA: hypothetical protein PLJ78_05515 [Anaerolineae bacterium]|nr:hypothetical protein [Anaerolineae bacterium]HQK13384.1 hypothetical protein [Anaerolineae bacterium]
METDSFTDILLPMIFFLVIGIIGVTAWTTWLIFRIRYKDKLQGTVTPPPEALFPESEHRASYLLGLTHTPDGAWEVDVQGVHYASLEAVPNDDLRQEVVAGLKELVAFARSYVQREQTARKQPQPEPHAKPFPETVTPVASPVPQATEPQLTPFSSVAKPAGGQAVQDRLRVYLKGEPELKRPDAAPTILPTLDLAREIGEIVAEMQARIPSLAHRSIRLQNAPSGGVQFAIDGIVYPNVDEIPDADIQALIRAATKEWERR